MAIKIAYASKFGISLPDAYVKIERWTGQKDFLCLSVSLYATQEARDTGTPVMEHFNIELGTNDAHNLASLYTYLKTLPEFAGAVDC